MVEAIEQGTCTECGHSDDNFSVDKREFHSAIVEDDEQDDEESDEPQNGTTRTLTCNCGAEASVTITEDGLETSGEISHEHASWTPEPDDE